jgi:hypothetical protein
LIQTADQIDKKVDPNVAKYISDIVGTLIDPILCWPGYEDDKPPKEFMEIITIQRLLENMAALHEDREPLGTDAEVSWYISTRSFEGPMPHEWCKIYQYCFTKTRENMNKDVPDDLRIDNLTDYEMNYHLLPLKRWIYQKRCEHRKEIDRQEKKSQREESKQQKIDLQPSMFEF